MRLPFMCLLIIINLICLAFFAHVRVRIAANNLFETSTDFDLVLDAVQV